MPPRGCGPVLDKVVVVPVVLQCVDKVVDVPVVQVLVVPQIQFLRIWTSL